MKKTISWILILSVILFAMCACVPSYEVESGTEAEFSTGAPTDTVITEAEPTEAEPTEAESTNTEPTDTEPTDTEPTEEESTEEEPIIPPLPEFPSEYSELQMMYRRAHGLEDDAAFEYYLKHEQRYKIPLPSLISVEHLYIGMPAETVFSMIPGYAMIVSRSNYRRYTAGGRPYTAIFFVDCDERYVVLELDKEERIEKITSYEKDEEVDPIDWDAVQSLRPGCTIYDVIEVAGFPRISGGNEEFVFTDFGLAYLAFVDWYDDNLRLYTTLTEVCTDERYSNTVVDRTDPAETTFESPSAEPPEEPVDPEEPTIEGEDFMEGTVEATTLT